MGQLELFVEQITKRLSKISSFSKNSHLKLGFEKLPKFDYESYCKIFLYISFVNDSKVFRPRLHYTVFK